MNGGGGRQANVVSCTNKAGAGARKERFDSPRLGSAPSTQVVVRTPQAELRYWMDGVGRFGLEQSRASKAACAPPGRP